MSAGLLGPGPLGCSPLPRDPAGLLGSHPDVQVWASSKGSCSLGHSAAEGGSEAVCLLLQRSLSAGLTERSSELFRHQARASGIRLNLLSWGLLLASDSIGLLALVLTPHCTDGKLSPREP